VLIPPGSLKAESPQRKLRIFYFPEKLSLLKALEGNKKTEPAVAGAEFLFSGGSTWERSSQSLVNLQSSISKFQSGKAEPAQSFGGK